MTHACIPDVCQPAPSRRSGVQTDRRRRSAAARRLALPIRATAAADVETRQTEAPARPDTAGNPVLQGLTVAGELVAAVAIIGGGIVLTALATLL